MTAALGPGTTRSRIAGAVMARDRALENLTAAEEDYALADEKLARLEAAERGAREWAGGHVRQARWRPALGMTPQRMYTRCPLGHPVGWVAASGISDTEIAVALVDALLEHVEEEPGCRR